MMHLARLAGLDDEADRGAQPRADQVMMHGRRRQQGRDRDAVGANEAVRQDDDVVAARNSLVGARAEPVDRRRHALRPALRGVGYVERLGVEGILERADRTDLLEVLVGEDRLAHLEPLLLRISLVVEQVRPRPDERDEAHHELLADRVDWRVRHLREVLLEIGVEQLRLRRQCRDRRVRPHRAVRLGARHRHRRHQEVQILLRVAERLLAIEQRDVAARDARLDAVQLLQHELRTIDPLLVGVQRAQLLLDVGVRDDAALLEVDQQHLARLQSPLPDDLLLRDRQDTGLRGHDHEPVVGDEVAGGAQAVAVERGADLAAVGEGHGGGAVPRLHHRGVILVEALALLIHQRVAGPGLGDQHHHRVGQRVAALHQELERVVEAGGVRLALVGDRPQLLDVLAKEIRRDRGLTRRHPVDVAAQRVDLAVVRHVAVGVRELPGRECVGREALVDQRQRRRQRGVAQIGEIFAELAGEQQTLVDDRPRRHRHGVIAGEALVLTGEDGVRYLLAQHEETPLEKILVGVARPAADEDLAGQGLARLDALAERLRVDRHVAPTQQLETLGGDRLLDDGDDLLGRLARLGQEHDADRVFALGRQREAESLGLLDKERVRDLQQHAAAVAGAGIGPRRAAMVDVEEDLQTLLDDVVRLLVVHVGDEADAAGIVLLGRIVEPLRRWQAGVAPSDATHGGVVRRERERRGDDLAARLGAAVIVDAVVSHHPPHPA